MENPWRLTSAPADVRACAPFLQENVDPQLPWIDIQKYIYTSIVRSSYFAPYALDLSIHINEASLPHGQICHRKFWRDLTS